MNSNHLLIGLALVAAGFVAGIYYCKQNPLTPL